jgi:hypothetical protein
MWLLGPWRIECSRNKETGFHEAKENDTLLTGLIPENKYLEQPLV